jgi:tetratricopeptide (TPR) repeat protein
MRRLLVLCLLPAALPAADRWTKFISGPYQIFTDAGPRAGRDAVVRFEEFRHAVGEVVGEPNLETPLPVRILLFKNSQGFATVEPVTEGRASFNIVLSERDAAASPAIYSALTRLFLQSNTAQMPPAFEHGLVEFFSTYSVKDIHITVGAPPPAADLDWARIHMLVTDPDYFGKLRVLLYNLRKGAAEDPAYRNAFGKSAADVEAQVKQRFAEHDIRTSSISSLPMAARDFPEREVSDGDARLARADLLAGPKSAAEYEALVRDGLHTAEAEEGLGLISLRENHPAQARTHFADAMRDGSSSARCYIEYAKLETDNAKASNALLKAAGINPKLDEPFALLAARDTDPDKRLAHWKLAAERNPRNTAYWQHLAEAYVADHNYDGAAKAWTSGEQSATDPAVRAQMHESRMAIEQQRLDYEEAERRRKAEEEAREIARLKDEARAQVHQLEQKYSDGKSADPKAVPWWDDPKTAAKAAGTLKQVDCLAGSQARLTIVTDDNKTVKLLVTDPAKLSIAGKGELTFRCGAQKPRRILVGYTPKVNARLATSGEAVIIEFQ